MLAIKETIHVQRGTIEFDSFEELKSQAIQVAEIIRQTEVNEENIQYAKKLLASANKAVNELESRRIAIKKEVMKPYQDFEVSVKEITSIVKDADSEIRSKVRELEELERQNKEEQLREIWKLRLRPYGNVMDFLTFEDWLRPPFLNKSTSITKVEENMVEWLEGVSQDIEAIKSLPDSVQVLAEYVKCLDIGLSIKTVNNRVQAQKAIERVVEKQEEKQPTKRIKTTVFYIEDEQQAKLTELLLKENNIKFYKERR